MLARSPFEIWLGLWQQWPRRTGETLAMRVTRWLDRRLQDSLDFFAPDLSQSALPGPGSLSREPSKAIASEYLLAEYLSAATTLDLDLNTNTYLAPLSSPCTHTKHQLFN